MHKIAEVTLSAAVASAGAITVSYPAGTTAGSFAAYGHKMFSRGLQAMFTQDAGGISASFGASNITVTYNGSTSIPADTLCVFELNLAGTVDAPDDLKPDIPKRVVYSPLLKVDLGAADTADANGYVESQDLTAAGVFSVNTTAAAAIAAAALAGTADVPRNVVAAWTTTAVLTVTGTDEYGNGIVESSASGTSFTGKKAFKTVTGISTSISITGLTVGTGDVLGLPMYLPASAQILAELRDAAEGVVSLTDSSGGSADDTLAAVAAIVTLTDSTGGSGTHDDTVADGLTTVAASAQTSATVTGTLTGTVDGVMEDIAATAASTAGGGTPSATNVDDGIATAVASIVTGTNLQLKELQTALNEVIADVTALYVFVGTVLTDLTVQNQNDSDIAQKVIELVTAMATTRNNVSDVAAKVNEIVGIEGTFVAGVQTAATATTGDVRGTYDPKLAANGSRFFSLLAAIPDPAYLGVDQYAG